MLLIVTYKPKEIVAQYFPTTSTDSSNLLKASKKLAWCHNPTNIYLFKVNDRNTRKRCEICSKLTIKTTKLRHSRSGVFIVNAEHISHHFPVFLDVILVFHWVKLLYFHLFRASFSSKVHS